jgi:hypothetical protein
MAINWGTLTGQNPTGGVVANLPMVPQSNGLNSLASGLMEGAKVGSDINRTNVLNKATEQGMLAQQQQMDQSAQLFPLQMEQERGRATEASTKARMLLQAEKDINNIRAAANQGEAEYTKVLMKTDPMKAQEYFKAKQDYQTAILQTAGQMAQTKQQELKLAANLSIQGYQMAEESHNADLIDPGSGAKVYAFKLKQMGPTLSAMFPQEWNENTNGLLHFSGMSQIANIQEAELKKSQTSTQKDLQRIGQLEEKTSLTKSEKIELDGLKAVQAGKERGQVNNAYDQEIASADKTTLTAAMDSRAKMISFRDFNEQAIKQLPKVPGYALGPISSALKLDALSQEAQVLKGYLAASTLLAKDILGLKGGTQGFTEGERKFVEQVAGGTFQNKVSLKQLTETMRDLSYKVELREWNKESSIRKNGSPDVYNRWLEANPKPSMPSSEMASKSYSLNGKPFDMEAAKKATGLSEEEIVKRAGL